MSASQRSWLSLVTLTAALLGGTHARAAGIDRDGLLSEAPATPDKGTVRVTAGSLGQASTDTGVPGQSSVSGSVLWAPFESFAGDVGVYWQPGPNLSGPSARVRYQFLSQERFGLDLAGGVRFKTTSFQHPTGTNATGEVEFLVAAGRRFGQFELVLNGVFGVEIGGGSGKDVEIKSFAGWRFSDQLRAGVDSRLQAEVGDEESGATPKIGRDFDFTAGPAVSWMLTRQINVQALVGVIMPKGTNVTSPVGMLAASFDF
jgi:hypothetical protein